MTKKDYILIADILIDSLREIYFIFSDWEDIERKTIVNIFLKNFSDRLNETQPRFNPFKWEDYFKKSGYKLA